MNSKPLVPLTELERDALTRLVDFERGFRFLGRLFVRSFIMASHEEDEVFPRLPVTIPLLGSADGSLDQPQRQSNADGREAASVSRAQGAPAGLLPPVPAVLPAAVETVAIISTQARGDPLPAEGWDPRQLAPEDMHDLTPVIRVLYVMTPGRRLTVRGEAFAVMEDEAIVAMLPPRRLGRIEIGPDSEVDTAAMRHALAWRVPLAFVGSAGATHGLLMEPEQRHGTLHLQQIAARLDGERALPIARAFADGRIRNQRALLNRLNRRWANESIRDAARNIGRIAKKLEIASSIDVVRGIEGESTRLFWPALGRSLDHGFVLVERDREPGAAPVNLMLNFAAALLMRDIGVLVLRHGLHPGIGFLHAARDTPGPLAWDLIEPFRAPLIEGLVVYAVNNRVVGAGHFAQSEDGRWAITPDGRDRFVRAYEAWMARPVKNHRRGHETVWRGLIEDDVLALRKAFEDGTDFSPYVMDY
jgi:CRISPR-associated protein Cas1